MLTRHHFNPILYWIKTLGRDLWGHCDIHKTIVFLFHNDKSVAPQWEYKIKDEGYLEIVKDSNSSWFGEPGPPQVITDGSGC